MDKERRTKAMREARQWATARAEELHASSSVWDSIPRATLFDLLRRAYSTGYAVAERDLKGDAR